MNLTSIISALAKLNNKELVTVKAAIEQLLGPHKALAASPSALSLYEAVKLACGSTAPYDRLMAGNMGKLWSRYSTEATSFIETTWPQAKRNKVVRMGLERLLISLLVDDLKEKGVKVTVGALVRNLGRFPEVFDSEFPDYRVSQLQHLVLKAMEKK